MFLVFKKWVWIVNAAGYNGEHMIDIIFLNVTLTWKTLYLPTTLGVKFDMRFMAQDFFGELNISMHDHMALNLKPTVYISIVRPLVNFWPCQQNLTKPFHWSQKLHLKFFEHFRSKLLDPRNCKILTFEAIFLC